MTEEGRDEFFSKVYDLWRERRAPVYSTKTLHKSLKVPKDDYVIMSKKDYLIFFKELRRLAMWEGSCGADTTLPESLEKDREYLEFLFSKYIEEEPEEDQPMSPVKNREHYEY